MVKKKKFLLFVNGQYDKVCHKSNKLKRIELQTYRDNGNPRVVHVLQIKATKAHLNSISSDKYLEHTKQHPRQTPLGKGLVLQPEDRVRPKKPKYARNNINLSCKYAVKKKSKLQGWRGQPEYQQTNRQAAIHTVTCNKPCPSE